MGALRCTAIDCDIILIIDTLVWVSMIKEKLNQRHDWFDDDNTSLFDWIIEIIIVSIVEPTIGSNGGELIIASVVQPMIRLNGDKIQELSYFLWIYFDRICNRF